MGTNWNGGNTAIQKMSLTLTERRRYGDSSPLRLRARTEDFSIP